MAQTDYYDTNAKYLGTFGSGTPVARQIIPRDDYNKITAAYREQQERAAQTFRERTAPRAGRAPAIDNSILARDLFSSDVEAKLLAASKTLNIQSNGAAVVAGLVQSAKSSRKEQGAYIALQYSTAKLVYIVANPVSSSEVDFVFSLQRYQDMRFVPGDMTMQIIATVHTHYANVAAMARTVGGGQVRYSIRPAVSDKDQNSARTEKIVVYAVDENYVHKAMPDGQARNKLARSLDITIDALESYGRN